MTMKVKVSKPRKDGSVKVTYEGLSKEKVKELLDLAMSDNDLNITVSDLIKQSKEKSIGNDFNACLVGAYLVKCLERYIKDEGEKHEKRKV